MTAMDVATQDGYGIDEQRAHFCDAPMLCTIDAAYGDGASLKWMIPHITDLCHKCGVKGKLDDMQMASLAKMIRNEFGYLKASELMLFFYRLKAGHYGEFYGQVDNMRIMRAMRGKFTEERVKAIDHHDGELRDRERQVWAKNALRPEQVEQLRKRLQDEGKI
jgi:hypothetical protein